MPTPNKRASCTTTESGQSIGQGNILSWNGIPTVPTPFPNTHALNSNHPAVIIETRGRASLQKHPHHLKNYRTKI